MEWRLEGAAEADNLDVYAVDDVLGNYRVAMVDCYDDTVSRETQVANARLMAAAPDLLAALELAKDLIALAHLCGAFDKSLRAGFIEQHTATISAAIAKARGA